MKRLVVAALLLFLVGSTDNARAQVYGGTGVVGFYLNDWGRVRLGVPEAVSPYRHLDRATVIFAIDSGAVLDYNEDVESRESAVLVSSPLADTAATTFSDGSYSGVFPDIAVRVTLLGWSGDSFVLLQHTLINETAAPLKGYLGIAVVPYLTELYGFETLEYDAASEVGYYYRTGEPAHVGFKVLSGEPYSFHVMDWEQYSLDPNDEVTTDTIRCFLTSTPGFDGKLDASNIGSIMHLTAGYREIAPGDSTTATYAILYGESPAELFTAAEAAQARYDAFPTSVEPIVQGVPTDHRLWQNYPNPFNPSTQIRFDLPEAGFVSLTVYDLLGREVARLVDGELTAGSHTVEFSGAGLPSGVYVASLTAGDFQARSKMLLMK